MTSLRLPVLLGNLDKDWKTHSINSKKSVDFCFNPAMKIERYFLLAHLHLLVPKKVYI